MSNGYMFTATCADCGTPLTHQATGEPSHRLAQAVAHCPDCLNEYVVRVVLEPVGRTRPNRNITPNTVVTSVLDATYPGRRRSWAR